VRSLLCCFLCVALLAVTTAARADDPTQMVRDPQSGDYAPPPPPFEPGRGQVLGIATAIGAVTGVIVGGMVLIFYYNPVADRNFSTVLIASGMIGTAAGIVLGMTLPVNAGHEDAPASLTIEKKEAAVDWKLPKVSLSAEPGRYGLEKIWHGNVFKLTF